MAIRSNTIYLPLILLARGLSRITYMSGFLQKCASKNKRYGLLKLMVLIRVANLPPEMLDDTLRAALIPSGQVLDFQKEMWARTYRYAVANGVRQANMMLTQHVPSHLVIAGQRVLTSYDGQPTTCYGCGDTGHLYPTCPRRQRRAQLASITTPVTYATVAAIMSQTSGDQPGDNIQGDSPHLFERVVESNDHSVDCSPHSPERCTSPMDSIQDAELGDPHTPQTCCTLKSDGTFCPSLPEVTEPHPPGKRTTPANKSQGLMLDICQVREMPQNPDRLPPPTVFQIN